MLEVVIPFSRSQIPTLLKKREKEYKIKLCRNPFQQVTNSNIDKLKSNKLKAMLVVIPFSRSQIPTDDNRLLESVPAVVSVVIPFSRSQIPTIIKFRVAIRGKWIVVVIPFSRSQIPTERNNQIFHLLYFESRNPFQQVTNSNFN